MGAVMYSVSDYNSDLQWFTIFNKLQWHKILTWNSHSHRFWCRIAKLCCSCSIKAMLIATAKLSVIKILPKQYNCVWDRLLFLSYLNWGYSCLYLILFTQNHVCLGISNYIVLIGETWEKNYWFGKPCKSLNSELEYIIYFQMSWSLQD